MAPSANLETITNKDLTWINIENPTREIMEEVAHQGYHFHELNIEDCLSKIQIPKMDRHEDYVFVVRHNQCRGYNCACGENNHRLQSLFR